MGFKLLNNLIQEVPMSIASIKLDESAKLEFSVVIAGAVSEPTGRLIIEGEHFDISFPCTYTNGTMIAEINELKGILPIGKKPVRLEVFVEGKVYTPLNEQIEFLPGVEVKSKPKQVKVNESKISVASINVVQSFSEDQLKVARTIADSLRFNGNSTNPSRLIEAAVCSYDVNKSNVTNIKNMLTLAEDTGIKITDSTLKHIVKFL